MAYLLIYNPTERDISEIALALAQGKSVQATWPTGSRKSMPIGSLVIVVKVGTEPRGIIGYGLTISPVSINRRCWNSEHGSNTSHVAIKLERLVDATQNPELILTVEELRESVLSHVRWTPRGSGNEIADRHAKLAIECFNDKLIAHLPHA